MAVDQSMSLTSWKLNSLARHHVHSKQVFETSENNYIMDFALEANSSSSGEVLSLVDILGNLQSKSPTIEQVTILVFKFGWFCI